MQWAHTAGERGPYACWTLGCRTPAVCKTLRMCEKEVCLCLPCKLSSLISQAKLRGLTSLAWPLLSRVRCLNPRTPWPGAKHNTRKAGHTTGHTRHRVHHVRFHFIQKISGRSSPPNPREGGRGGGHGGHGLLYEAWGTGGAGAQAWVNHGICLVAVGPKAKEPSHFKWGRKEKNRGERTGKKPLKKEKQLFSVPNVRNSLKRGQGVTGSDSVGTGVLETLLESASIYTWATCFVSHRLCSIRLHQIGLREWRKNFIAMFWAPAWVNLIIGARKNWPAHKLMKKAVEIYFTQK